MLVSKEFQFEAAHFLTKYHGACERLHGHTYRLRVTVEGLVRENGLVIDFSILKKIVNERVIAECDHRCLNDFLPNPSAELLAVWIWERLKNLDDLLRAETDNPNLSAEIKNYLRDPDQAIKDIPLRLRLKEVRLWETPSSCVIYCGEGEN